MSRTQSADPPVKVTTNLPRSIWDRVNLHIFSDVEQRIRPGSVSSFVKDRCIEFFDSKALDLAPYIAGVQPGTLSVRGTPAAIEALKRELEA